MELRLTWFLLLLACSLRYISALDLRKPGFNPDVFAIA